MKLRHAFTISVAAAIALPASAYQVSGSKWEDGQFRLYVGVPATVAALDVNGDPITWNDIIAQALAAWDTPVQGLSTEIVNQTKDPCEGYTGNADQIVSQPAPTNPSNPARDSAIARENGIGFAADVCGSDFGQGVVAVTLLQTHSNQPGFYSEADIIFNQAFQYNLHSNPVSTGSVGSPFDVRRIAIKQLGFALGLREEVNFPSIMHPDAETRSITSPTDDDLTGMRILYPTAPSTSDPDIRLAVEEPNTSQIKSGISNIRGWAIGLKEIRLVEVSIDNGSFQPIPYGSVRSDVSSAYSQYPMSGNSGYSMIFNWGSLSAGQHEIRVRAHDIDDNVTTVTRNFTVAKFNDNYISNTSINGSSSISNQKTVTLNNVNADNQNYTVKLEWDNAAQKFNIVSAQAN